MIDFKELIQSPPYDFLRTNPHLGDRIILLTLGGSYAYGTNVENSDVDIRGCTLNSTSDLLGFDTFEKFDDEQTDTTIYAFNKLAWSLTKCNPYAIELLGCKPEHYLILSDSGRLLHENRKMFLSQRAYNSFAGYAAQVMHNLKVALVGDTMSQPELERHLKYVLEHSISSIQQRFPAFDENSLSLHIADSSADDLSCEVLADFSMKDVPVRQFKGMLDVMVSITKNCQKLSKRNRKSSDAKLGKHAMHIVRLYLEGLDILEKEEIITNREKDLDLLMSIRRGDFQKEDGTFIPEFYEMISDLERKLTYAKENTSLPVEPDIKKIEELVISINMGGLYD